MRRYAANDNIMLYLRSNAARYLRSNASSIYSDIILPFSLPPPTEYVRRYAANDNIMGDKNLAAQVRGGGSHCAHKVGMRTDKASTIDDRWGV